MASLGHIAIGLSAGRLYCSKNASTAQLAKAMLAFSALSMAPDADVIAFALKVPYGAPFGHRGATHSIGAAVFAGFAGWLLGRLMNWPAMKTGVMAGLVVLSHALLDSLTNGGLGVALWWPFSNERVFAPFNPIPVAPIGLGMVSLRGLLVMAVELVMFLPFIVYATFPRRQSKPA